MERDPLHVQIARHLHGWKRVSEWCLSNYIRLRQKIAPVILKIEKKHKSCVKEGK